MADPSAGELAQLRLGILHFEVRDFPASRRYLEPLGSSASDAFHRYLANLVLGLGLSSEGRTADAAAAFTRAVAIDPAVKSGAVELAAHHQMLNQPDEAAAIMNGLFSTRALIDDPWQRPCAHCSGWSRRQVALHAMVKR